MKKIKKIMLLIISFSFLLVGCNNKKIKIAYTVYPVQFLLEEIGQDKVETMALSNNTMVLRSQLADNYKEVLEDTQALFVIGELEPYMDIINQDIIDINPNIIDLSVKSGVFEFSRVTRAMVDNQIVDVKSNYYENPIFDSIDVYTRDPYLWLDPITMTSMANQVRDYLVEKDPDNTDFYNRNFEKLKMELAYLDADFLNLRNDNNLRLATITPSFGIWQNNYYFTISPIILSKYGVLPSEQQLELIKVRLINDNIQYLIIEEDMDEDMINLANQLSEELSLKQITLSSLSYLSKRQKNAKLNYIDIMNENLLTLTQLQASESIKDSELVEEIEENQ